MTLPNLFPRSDVGAANVACAHASWTARLMPRSDGLPVLREFCHGCGLSSSGSALGHALPSIPDAAVLVTSYKYPGMALGDIHARDPDYLVWLVTSSSASSRARKAAARILRGSPYSPPAPGSVYPASLRYDPAFGWQCVNEVVGACLAPVTADGV